MQPIKNIIFDLGGVLLDIDFTRSFKAFNQLGIHNFEELYSQHKAAPFFSDFEKGQIPIQTFFDKIREICGCPLTNEQIREAWNALLIGFPPERLDWFHQIRTRYRVFLFSNTNAIHYNWFIQHYHDITGQDFNSCFIKAYYSHEMGLRKPDPDSYRYILNEQNLDPSETLFIDDTEGNILAAKELGLQTVHLLKPLTVLGLEGLGG